MSYQHPFFFSVNPFCVAHGHYKPERPFFYFSYVGCSFFTSMHVSLLGYGKMFAVIMKFISVW